MSAPVSLPRWATVAVAAGVLVPAGILLFLETIILAAAGLTGANPRAPIVSINLAEAVAVRDTGEIARLIENGDDPNRRYRVRDGLLADKAIDATPLEAAVAQRREELVTLLYANGATPDAALWRRLACFAKDAEAEDVLSVLNSRKPADVPMQCGANEPLFGSGQ